MISIFKKYYITVSAFKTMDSGLRLVTDVYYLDKNGRLSQIKPMKDHAQQFSYFKAIRKIKKITQFYDKSKWDSALVEVSEMDFVKYVQEGE